MSDNAEPAEAQAPGLILRPRLLELLGGLRPLTVVAAPAGYGKSALVESWVAEPMHDVTVVRLSLEDDNLPADAWWPTLVEVLGDAGVAVSGGEVVAGPRDPHRRWMKGLAADIAAHGRRVVLILDCGEFSMSAQVASDLDRLIRDAGTGLAVVMLTREDPPSPLHRLRLEGRICEVRAQDLAFSASEVAALMNREGVVLTPPEVSALRTRTGGWPAGLRFAAMSLRGRSDVSEAIESFRGDTGNVAEYLMTEVLQRQPARRRRFLLRSCIVEELDPPLVELLTGQHCDLQVLEVMADSGCFLERIPGQQHRFRYHALFRQLLCAQLWLEDSPTPEELHRVAAGWLARDGQTFRAVRHAVAGSDWASATRLLVEHMGYVELLSGHRRAVMRKLFADLPRDLSGAEAALTRTAMSLAELDATSAGMHLDAARASLEAEAAPGTGPRRAALAVLTALQTSLALDTPGALDTALRAALTAEQELRLLPSRDLVTARSHLAAVVAACKGRVLFARGEFLGAVAAFRDGMDAAEAARLEGVASELKGMCSLVEAVTGHLRRATALAAQVTHTRSTSSNRAEVPSEAARLALAWVRTDEAEPGLANELLGQAQREPASYDSHLLATVATLLRARLLVDRGEAHLALAELEIADTPRSALPSGVGREHGSLGWLARTLVAWQADTLTYLGRPREAIELIRRADVPGDERHEESLDLEIALQRALLVADDPGRDVSRLTRTVTTPKLDDAPLAVDIDRLLVLAEGSVADHDLAAAGAYLDQALRVAAPEHLRRPILQASRGIRAVVTDSGLSSRNRWLHPHADGPGGQEAAVHIPEQRRASHAEGTGASDALVIPLTRKETEVLGYLAKLLTTDEIAAVMFVSVNTVRSHVRSILRKLGVSRRNEAVRRAWDLQLLPPESAA